jgi:hypothetical protein
VSHAVDLSPTRFAELVAPAISRAFVAGMRSPGNRGRDLIASYGGPEATGYVIDLRNPLAAGRPVTRDSLAHHYRYTDPIEVDRTLKASVEADLLAWSTDGEIAATGRGGAFVAQLSALQADALGRRWRGQAQPVARLNDLLGRVLAEAAATGGAAWGVQAPPHEPDGSPPELLLVNRLSTMRYHRADAHAAAWQAAGLTVAEMVAMPLGSQWTPQRSAVEHDTNVRAGVPYAVLTPPQRLAMLADLSALP